MGLRVKVVTFFVSLIFLSLGIFSFNPLPLGFNDAFALGVEPPQDIENVTLDGDSQNLQISGDNVQVWGNIAQVPPELVSSDPPKDSIGGRIDRVEFEFNIPLDPSTVNNQTVAVGMVGVGAVKGSVSLLGDGKRVWFSPEMPLRGGVKYLVILSGAIKSAIGTSFPGAIYTFTTQGRMYKMGDDFVCTHRDDENQTKCWGRNSQAQALQAPGAPDKILTPTSIAYDLGDVQEMSLSALHGCAVVDQGTVKCWGFNYGGELGVDTGGQQIVPQPQTVPVESARSVATGPGYSCAIHFDDTVSCWGELPWDKTIQGEKKITLPPKKIDGLTNVAEIAASGLHLCARHTNGHLSCMGWYAYGQFDNGTNATEPVQVFDIDNSVKKVVTGYSHTCVLLNDLGAQDGTSLWVRCWGRNNQGQLGIGPIEQQSVPTLVGGLTEEGDTIEDIDAGGDHTCAVIRRPTGWRVVKCWGGNHLGHLGTEDSSEEVLQPSKVAGAEQSNMIEVGAGPTCGMSTTGRLLCWGSNMFGALGNGTEEDSATPIQVNY